ncbi:RnfH family protein [Psychromonas aquimarina]|uniref:RnfH family protein n=1 Tax=Psychromonas aquimarina TaxID=444919 RepID=UPI0003FB2192|nr:RnfH family protein [Psychromonas aquimarina]
MNNLFEIEVVYGRPDRQVLLPVLVSEGCTIAEAIVLSGICAHFPEIKVTEAKVGIFSRPEKLESLVKVGDRVEIYRPLIADPKEMRKLRAAKMSAK